MQKNEISFFIYKKYKTNILLDIYLYLSISECILTLFAVIIVNYF